MVKCEICHEKTAFPGMGLNSRSGQSYKNVCSDCITKDLNRR